MNYFGSAVPDNVKEFRCVCECNQLLRCMIASEKYQASYRTHSWVSKEGNSNQLHTILSLDIQIRRQIPYM